MMQPLSIDAGFLWAPADKDPLSFHLVCQTFFTQHLDSELLSKMLAQLECQREKQRVACYMQFHRQVEIDMDNDCRKQIRDLAECVACAAILLQSDRLCEPEHAF